MERPLRARRIQQSRFDAAELSQQGPANGGGGSRKISPEYSHAGGNTGVPIANGRAPAECPRRLSGTDAVEREDRGTAGTVPLQRREGHFREPPAELCDRQRLRPPIGPRTVSRRTGPCRSLGRRQVFRGLPAA